MTEKIELENVSDTKKLSEVAPDMVEMYKSTIFECDECEKSFKTNEIIVKSADNIEFAGLLGVKAHKANNHTWYLHCPYCEEPHLFGFDLKKP